MMSTVIGCGEEIVALTLAFGAQDRSNSSMVHNGPGHATRKQPSALSDMAWRLVGEVRRKTARGEPPTRRFVTRGILIMIKCREFPGW